MLRNLDKQPTHHFVFKSLKDFIVVFCPVKGDFAYKGVQFLGGFYKTSDKSVIIICKF